MKDRFDQVTQYIYLVELIFECRSVRFQSPCFVSIHWSSITITQTCGDRIRPCRRMYPSCANLFFSCAVNPLLPSCTEFSIRGPQTKVVHIALANESNLQMMVLGPLLLSVIMSNLYISHRSCRLIYQGKKRVSKNLLVFFFSASEITDLDVSMRQH